jgi:hypothetical protein
MTDAELRALVRTAVGRHLGGLTSAPSPPVPQPPLARAANQHPSHYLYLTVLNTGDSCVIEPGVTCNHCGYCKSHGH